MIHGVNLHNVVRSAITAIHPVENCILYQSIGQRNVKGKVTPVYAEPINVKANFQPLDSETLRHVEALSVTGVDEQVFMYSDEQRPVTGQQRIPTRTGDVIQRGETYWLVTAVFEDWTWDGWANVGVHRQTTPPDFSASEWSDSYVRSDK
jgi:hypothetical protein